MSTLVLAALLAVQDSPPPPASIPWDRDHRAAYTEAEERRTPLLIHFRSDDCPRTAVGDATSALNYEASDCDRMEEVVWSRDDVRKAAARYVPVITGDTADRTLTRRYEVGTVPTTLIADPWGNEVVRLVHFVDAARMARILKAMPSDFSALQPIALELRRRPHDGELLAKAAAFYEGARLAEIAERYYERAAGADAAKKDRALRRRLAVARGTNLLRIGKAADAARVFREAFEDAPEGAQGETVLFGWMMAELQQSRVKEADRPYRELLSRFPESKYAARAKENMAAATKD
jgi:tetratricopeptide (TPR) repeat protein